MPDTLKTQLRRWIEPGLTALPTRLQPHYSARAEEEIAGFEDVGWLDQAADVVSAIGRLVAHGVPLIAAHRSCESMVFFLAGLTGTDPVAERLSDAFLPGIIGLDPAWLWFGPLDAGTHVSAHPALANLLQLARDSALACRWRNSAPHEIRRLRAQKPLWEAYLPRRAPESWSDLVLQHACNTPGGGRIGMYQAAAGALRNERRPIGPYFKRTGGVPVFEDDVVQFFRQALGPAGADSARVNALRRAVRCGDNDCIGAALGPERMTEFDLLATYGPSTQPRSVAMGEARLELCNALVGRSGGNPPSRLQGENA